MGRYRPPTPKPSLYITACGYTALEKEAKQIWQQRTHVTRALSAAAAEGDRSENAEYIYRKKELREIDRRIRYLQKRMPVLKVVSAVPTDSSRIFFGAWVSIDDENALQATYRIVGPDEIDIKKRWISVDSPLARALLNKSLSQEVSVQTPTGSVYYYIAAISYTKPKPRKE